MSATTTSPRTTRYDADGSLPPVDRSAVTLPRVVHGELTKLTSLRSTWLLLLLVVAVSLGLAALTGYGLSGDGIGGPGGGGPPGIAAGPAPAILSATSLGALLLGVLGALSMSGEHASGTITATLTAVPRRWPVLVGKVLALTAVVVPLALALSAGALLLGGSFFAEGERIALIDDGVAVGVLGNAGSMLALALCGLGVATLLRSSAGSITLLVALVFIVPPLLPIVGVDWITSAADLTPVTAAISSATTEGTPTLTDGESVATLLGWALVPLAAGAVALQRRDA